ncbi:efflux RND transporter periplasmic adaptor subunit [Aquimarina agarilytica]|uniref:efflux RND transporter periplasmic adaptor subunit n=1 Tax=Aquimarina agarilytica TaxID=1087449 RepID=UPI0002888E32|nr:HlyD family efflux transporter periplasmic adaptor subunit [Aquimarina agarilytica]
MRKIILSLIGVLLIVGSFLFSKKMIANKKKPKPVSEKVIKTVFTDTVKNGKIKISIPASGSLVAKRRVELFSEVQGIFKAGNKLFKPGQQFNKGQTLIRIDANEHYANVQAAKSNLYNAIAAIMPDLRLDFSEVYPKWKSYLTAFDLSKTAPELPKLETEKERFFISGRGIVSTYYTVKNLEQRLSKYVVRAPFSGILTESLVTEGSLIRNGQKLGEFIDPSVYEIEVAISQSLVSFLKLGESVLLNNLEKTTTYTGVISRINGNIDSSTQTVTVYIEVKSKDLKEGQFLEAMITAKEEPNAIEIDRNLLMENNQVFMLRDSVLDIINVKPIYFTDKKVVLKSVPDHTVLLKRPVPGAYGGMIVKPYVAHAKSAQNR